MTVQDLYGKDRDADFSVLPENSDGKTAWVKSPPYIQTNQKRLSS
ncbi:hypothetical protein [Cellulophaga sp. Hel_I_12]|nr:hypothetical protein [Cellulophaga sp. Hel_I_12]